MSPALLEQHRAHLARLERMHARPAGSLAAIVPKPEPVAVVSIAPEPDDPLPIGMSPRVRARHMAARIAKAHGFTFADLAGDRRTKPVSMARREVMWAIAKELTIEQMSLAGIGRLLRKDHTTVIAAIRAANDDRGTNIRNLGGVTEKRKQKNLFYARRSNEQIKRDSDRRLAYRQRIKFLYATAPSPSLQADAGAE